MTKAKKKVRRVILGIGYPWYSSAGQTGRGYDTVQLTAQPVSQSILSRGGETTVALKYDGTGNWNKVRLVLEILK